MGSSLELNTTSGLIAKAGDFISGDGKFIEIKVPLSGSGSVIDICSLAEGGIINLGSYLSFSGGSINAKPCGQGNINVDINVTGTISGGKTYCSGSPNSTLLTLTGNYGAVKKWQKQEDGINWVDIPNTANTNTYTATNVTVNTNYRAVIVNNTCPNKEVYTGIDSITINSLDDPSFSYSASSYCDDSNDPTPTVTGVSGGSFSSTSGLVINSSTGIIDLDASSSGTYIIQYSTGDAGTCTNTSTQSVTITKTPVITNPGAQAGCDSYTLPAILGSNLSGNQAYYNNSKANGGTVITGSITTTQTVWIYDANGSCSNEESFEVTIQDAPEAGTSGSLTVCEGTTITDAMLFDELTGADAGGSWSAPVNGVYTYTVAATAPCTEDTSTVTVTIQEAPEAGTSGTLTVCEGTEITDAMLFAGLTGADAGGSWSAPVNGVYTYTVAATAPCTNEDTATVTVTIQDAPEAGTSGTLTVCEGTEISDAMLFAELTGADAGGSWSAPVNGVYTYTVAATAPCTTEDTATVTVTIQDAPEAGTGGTLTVCEGTDITDAMLFAELTGADAGGSWSAPVNGVYTYTVNASAPCDVDATSTVTVTVQPAPNAGTSGTLTVCEGTEITDAMLFAELTGADAGGSWSAPVNGVYTYTVAATAPCTTEDTATVTVTIQDAPEAGTSGTLTVCEGTDITDAMLFAELTGADAGGSWSAPVNGVYTYTVAATAPCTTEDTATVTVTIQDAPEAGTSGTLTVCEGTDITDAMLFAKLTGADAGGSWSAPVNGVYTYTVAATAPCTTEDTATVTVTIQDAPEAGNNGTLTVCEGTTITDTMLFAELTGADDNGTWSGPVEGVYTYTVAATAPCANEDTATVTVTIQDAP